MRRTRSNSPWVGLAFLLVAASLCLPRAVLADTLDTIGLTLLRITTTNLNGTGVRVAQPEAGAPAWEVNPAATGQPVSLFTYAAAAGKTNTFPNDLGTESTHADSVGNILYGFPAGVATNVAGVDAFDANYFFSTLILQGASISAPLVNQSFIITTTVSGQQSLDSAYDNYAALHSTLFISGAGNDGVVNAPSTAYNGISVAAYGGSSSVGPTADNGRSKPDLTAPASLTSFSTPLVTGAAAILRQAGLRGDGGADTNAVTDIRSVKALLLNGAIKPADWTHTKTAPLDTRYGAGVLNVFNSYRQLAAGKLPYTSSTSVTAGTPHPPPVVSGDFPVLRGWDFNTHSSSSVLDGVNHYFFDVFNNVPGATFTATVTLVWNRQAGQTRINDLDLFLYDTSTGDLIASSTSTVDNVEHLYLPNLAAGRYDLQVVKYGGTSPTKRVTNNETYALAFDFFSVSVGMESAADGVTLTWPVYPAGFVVESATALGSSITWSAVNGSPTITNDQNRLPLGNSAGFQFFRLRRP